MNFNKIDDIIEIEKPVLIINCIVNRVVDGRPLLKNGDPKKILENLYAIRDPLYREIADHVIETGKPSVNQLVNTLIMQLELSH